MPEKLTEEQLQALALRFGLETAVLQSLAETASETDAFLPDGRASLFFEGHLFYRNLEKAGISPDTCRAGNENILFQEPTIRYDEGGAGEYARLDKARAIHPKAALMSASYGMFQIPGERYADCGFDSVEAFVSAQNESACRQLETLCTLLKTQGAIPLLCAHDWPAFSRRYTGTSLAPDDLAWKMGQAYYRHTVRSGNRPGYR